MSNTDELITNLILRFRLSGLTKVDLAARANIHQNTLRDMMSPHWNPRLETLRKIDAALREPVTQVSRRRQNGCGLAIET